jgi:hypothetical protein
MDQFEIIEDAQFDVVPEKKCKACKKGFKATHWAMLLFSVYILIASIYGTIKIAQILINLF